MTTGSQRQRVTRLVPLPSDALRLGKTHKFLISWTLGRQNAWEIVLWIDDLDEPRIKPNADLQAIDFLSWLGIDGDRWPVYQRSDLSSYEKALNRLRERGQAYPCSCTRKKILLASLAPHDDWHEVCAPGTCRSQKNPPTGNPVSLRVQIPKESIRFGDQFHGPEQVNVQRQIGDFIVAKKPNLPAYQLAVVVGDARQYLIDVVLDDDLLPSTGRQLGLCRMLDLHPAIRYWHLPLIVGDNGRCLAKRHGASRISWCRKHGVNARHIIGLMAKWCRLVEAYTCLDAAGFMRGFDLARLPRQAVRFTNEDHAWLVER